jgi:glutamine cyclotransferase
MNRYIRTIVNAIPAVFIVAFALSCTRPNTPIQDPTATNVIPAASKTPTTEPPRNTAVPTPTPESPLPVSPLPSPTPPGHSNSPIPPPPPSSNNGSGTPTYTYRIVNTFPHDPDAFTEGLVYEDGWLYESTGLRGNSSLRRVELASGDVIQFYELPADLFGEGVTVFDDRVIQLTWTSNVGFVYDKGSFELLREFQYPSQGWGFTHDGEHLIMSDGTATLHYLDPETFDELWQIQVFDENGPVVRLNELEFIDGEIYANVWQTDLIARIDPGSGRVMSWLDLTGLLQPDIPDRRVDVLNGIAYDPENSRLFVTGKWWPELYEIVIVEEGNE